MTGRGPLSSFTGVNVSYVLRELIGTVAVLPESFAQNFCYMNRDVAGVTAPMDPLIAKDTNFKRGLAGAVGFLSGLNFTFQGFEVKVHETLVKR